MKKLMLTALLCLYAAWLAFTRNSPPPAASSRQRAAIITDTALLPSDTAPPILTTIILVPAIAAPGRLPSATAPAAAEGLPQAKPVRPNPAVPPRPVTLRVFIRDSSLSLSGLVLEWELQVNGVIRQKGAVSNPVIGPQRTGLVHLPVRPPVADGDEAFLQVQYRYRKAVSAAGARQPASPATNTRQPASPATSTRQPIAATTPMGPVIAEAQLLLKAPTRTDLVIRAAGELSFTDSNDIFTIQSPAIHLEFNKQTGWLQRYTVKGAVLLDDTAGLRSIFWLPGGDTVAPWLEATRDPRLQLFSTSTGSEMVIVRAEYTLPATSCLMHLSYTVNALGEIGIGQSLESDSTQKGSPLPCFGMQWALPAGFDSITYYGLGVRQSDSVRAAAARIGIYRQQLSAPPSPDTRSREMTTATAVRWWKITGPGHSGLLITADSSLFNGSALHASPIRLNIYYRQPATGSVFEDAPGLSFHLPYGNYRYGYKITPVTADHP